MSLKGKIVFITGASGGIGAATAMAFAAEGARLLLAARRADKLAVVASLALERGAQAVHSIDLDVRNHRAVQDAIDTLRQIGLKSTSWSTTPASAAASTSSTRAKSRTGKR